MSKSSREAKKLRTRKERVKKKLSRKLSLTRENRKLEREIHELKLVQQDPIDRLTSLRNEQSDSQND